MARNSDHEHGTQVPAADEEAHVADDSHKLKLQGNTIELTPPGDAISVLCVCIQVEVCEVQHGNGTH